MSGLELRASVAELIVKVLTDKMLVREALLQFPSSVDDPSIQVAWHALCHREADEDFRKRDSLYADEQDEYLEMIAFTLQKGDELPVNIVAEYKPYYKDIPISPAKGFKGMWKKLMRPLTWG